MMGWGFGLGSGFGWLGMVEMPLVWLTLLAFVIWAAVRLFPTGAGDGRESALDILKRRYASGEITQTEFEQAREALGYGSKRAA